MCNCKRLTLALGLALLGCASPPKEARSAVDTFRAFLLEADTPLQDRAALLGLQLEIDPTTLPLGEGVRLGASPGNLIRFSRLVVHQNKPPLLVGSMTNIFDSAVICVKRTDVAALGPIYPGDPIIEHRMIGGDLRVSGITSPPEYINLEGKHGRIRVNLITFERGCLAEVEHTIHFAK